MVLCVGGFRIVSSSQLFKIGFFQVDDRSSLSGVQHSLLLLDSADAMLCRNHGLDLNRPRLLARHWTSWLQHLPVWLECDEN